MEHCISYKNFGKSFFIFPHLFAYHFPQEHCSTVCENLIWKKGCGKAATGKNENKIK